ncbi:MAG: type III pantothenate kinase [Planctomycetes bacterium]|nr:type III pantothenate kinase [Planctomycetota bacterium]
MNEEIKEVPHVLACDVGNSAVHFAHVHGDVVGEMQTIQIGRLGDLGSRLAALWDQIPAPRKVAAASVNAVGTKALEAAVLEHLQQDVLLVGRDLPLPMQVDVEAPDKVGADRVCAAVAAFDRLGVACVVADFGSAITVDCVNDEGVFLGGAIMPGLRMSIKALHEQTSMLPLVEPVNPDWVYGKNTSQAIAGGVVFGARGALKELIESYATELGHWPTVIATGGDATLVVGDVNESGLVQAIVPDLVLRGAAMAYYNTLAK